MPNVFNNDTTLPKRIRNINKLNIDQNVIVSINEFNEATAKPISTYGASLINTTDANALATSLLKNTEESITFLADGANEINFHTGLNGGTPTSGNLRLKINDNDITSYNDLKIQNGNNTMRFKLLGNNSKIDAETGELYIEANNGVNITKNDANVLSSNGDNLKLYRPLDGSLKIAIGGNIDFYTNLIASGTHDIGAINYNWNNVYANTFTNAVSGQGYLTMAQGGVNNTGYISFHKALGARTMYMGFSDNNMNDIRLESDYSLQITSAYPNKTFIVGGTTNPITTQTNNIEPIAHTTYNIGSSSTRFNNVYSTTNNSSNYSIIDGGYISLGTSAGVQLLRFLDGTGYSLANTYLFQIVAGKKTRFTQNGLTTSFLEFDTANNNVNIGETGHTTTLNTCNILPQITTTYNIGTPTNRYANLYLEQILFDGTTSKKIEFFGNNYSQGVQGSTLYFRSDLNYAFYKGGSHSNTALDPGTGGTKLLTIENDKLKTQHIEPLAHNTYNIGSTSNEFTHTYTRNLTTINILPNTSGFGGIGTSSSYFGSAYVNSMYADVLSTNTSSLSFITLYKTLKPALPIASSQVDLGQDALPTASNPTGEYWFRNTFTNNLYVNNVSVTSDKRLKQNITPLKYGLDFINQLNPVEYQYKSNTNGRCHFGLISQELKDVLQTDKYSAWGLRPNKFEFINYTELISPLIKAVQQLDNKFNQLDCSGVIIKEVEKGPALPVLGEIDCNCDCNIEKIIILEERLNENNYNNKVALNKLQDVNNNLLNANDELLIRINELENKLENVEKQPQHNSDDESDNANTILDLIQQRLYEIEKRNTKLEAKVKKQTTIINKLLKSSESTIKN